MENRGLGTEFRWYGVCLVSRGSVETREQRLEPRGQPGLHHPVSEHKQKKDRIDGTGSHLSDGKNRSGNELCLHVCICAHTHTYISTYFIHITFQGSISIEFFTKRKFIIILCWL